MDKNINTIMKIVKEMISLLSLMISYF